LVEAAVVVLEAERHIHARVLDHVIDLAGVSADAEARELRRIVNDRRSVEFPSVVPLATTEFRGQLRPINRGWVDVFSHLFFL
jgi:hypothetical protein